MKNFIDKEFKMKTFNKLVIILLTFLNFDIQGSDETPKDDEKISLHQYLLVDDPTLSPNVKNELAEYVFGIYKQINAEKEITCNMREEKNNLYTLLDNLSKENSSLLDSIESFQSQLNLSNKLYKDQSNEFQIKFDQIKKQNNCLEKEIKKCRIDNFEIMNKYENSVDAIRDEYVEEINEYKLKINILNEKIVYSENIIIHHQMTIEENEKKINQLELKNKIKDEEYLKLRQSYQDDLLLLDENYKKNLEEQRKTDLDERKKIIDMIKEEKNRESLEKKKRENVNQMLISEIDEWKVLHQESLKDVEKEKKKVDMSEQERQKQAEEFRNKDKTGKKLEEAGKQVAKETQRIGSQINSVRKKII